MMLDGEPFTVDLEGAEAAFRQKTSEALLALLDAGMRKGLSRTQNVSVATIMALEALATVSHAAGLNQAQFVEGLTVLGAYVAAGKHRPDVVLQ